VINNGTDINARCARSNSLRKLGAERANGRDALKNIVGAELPFPFFPLPSSLLLFLLPYFYIFSRPRLRNMRERVSSLAGAAKRHLVNFGLKLAKAILVIITLYVCSPLGCNGLKCRPCRWPPGATSPLRTPSRRHCLPSCRTLPPFGQYQIIPHCLCVNNLPRVIT